MSKKPEETEHEDRQLDELLSMRGKPFGDWKEEREYLRRKWGEQGKRIPVVRKAMNPQEDELPTVGSQEDSA